jgi:hypothetical protein
MVEIPVFLIALGFAVMGASALARPASIGRYFDVRIESADGRNEVRAVYGGFGIAIALALILATQVPALWEGVIVCVGIALAGMAGGRLFSAVLERPGFWPWFFCGVEVGAAGLLWWTLHG